ncbi:MAG TPA: hypothetical protein VGL13_08260 [Polyangiaceae bacterium]
MWEQYKQTFAKTQMVILMTTLGVFFWSHVIPLALLFFATMQVGSVVGAMWGYRLKAKTQRALFSR